MKEITFNEQVDNFINEENYKVVTFRNIKEFGRLYFERCNPNHVITIWGLPFKKFRKTNYPHYIRMGKILIKLFFPLFTISLFTISIAEIFFGLILSYAMINWFIYIIDICNGDENKCLLELKENLVVEKQF